MNSGVSGLDRGLLITTLLMVAFGLLMVLNASIPISTARFPSPNFLFYRQLAWAAAGVAALFITSRIPMGLLGKSWIQAAMLAGIYGLLAIVLFQEPINNTRRWIHASGFSVQPSELAKLAAVIFMAWYLARNDSIKERPLRHLIRLALIFVPLMILIALEPDLGSTVMILLIVTLFLFLAGFPLKYMLVAGLAAVPVLAAAVLASPYQLQRISSFLSPGADPQGKGYHIMQSLVAIGHGGFWGLGLGQSSQKMYFLPEPHTDFIYAVIAEELGLLGCAALTGAFLYLFYRGLKISLHHPDLFRRWLGTGLTALILLQALINTSMVVNLGPTKGIPLPFISMGGTSLFINLVMIGLLLNISREAPE